MGAPKSHVTGFATLMPHIGDAGDSFMAPIPLIPDNKRPRMRETTIDPVYVVSRHILLNLRNHMKPRRASMAKQRPIPYNRTRALKPRGE